MTPEHQRVAIAEACGWTEIEPCTCCNGVSRAYEPTPGAHKKHLPNYLNNLNDMREAENVLFPVEVDDLYGSDLVKEYGDILQHLCCGNPGGIMRATASQRAEAFLRTIGKWEEAK